MENYLDQDRYKMCQMEPKCNYGIGGMWNMPCMDQIPCTNQMLPHNHMMECGNKMTEMPLHMCGKCGNVNMSNTMPWGYGRGGYHYPMYGMSNTKMEPIENMCGNTYKIMMVSVEKTVKKIMMENMGMMPKAIAKEKFNKEMNEMLCEIMSHEDEIKSFVIVDRSETEANENTDRAFCPYCNGLLKDTLGILFITELLRGGCVSCY